jgi:Caspase domain/PDZ domain
MPGNVPVPPMISPRARQRPRLVVTRRTAAAFLAAELVIGPSTFAAMSQSAPDQRRRVALVMGNQSYRYVTTLQNSRNDAAAMAARLRDCGFEVVDGYDLERSEMNMKFAEFESKLSAGVIAVIYFAGHGIQVAGSNVLLPIDIQASTPNSVIDNGIVLSTLMERVAGINEAARGGFNFFIVDACRDNPFQVQGRSIGEQRGLQTSGATGTMVLYAAGTNQRALDSDKTGQHGLFTSVLLREMSTGGVDVRTLIVTVRREVSQLAAQEGSIQIPAVYDEATEAAFQFVPADVPPVASRDLAPRPEETAMTSSAQVAAELPSNVGWLGAHVEPSVLQRGITPKAHFDGVLVDATNSAGPAAAAGIRKGDTILKFEGIPVSDARGLEKLVGAARTQRQVAVRISRDGAEITTLVSNPSSAPSSGPAVAARPVRHEHPHPRRSSSGSDIW